MEALILSILCLSAISISCCGHHSTTENDAGNGRTSFLANNDSTPIQYTSTEKAFYVNEQLLPHDDGPDSTYDYWIPFAALKKKFGDKLPDISYMSSIYGKPKLIDTSMVYYGTFDSREDYVGKIKHIPKCQVMTYEWRVDERNILLLYFIRTRKGWILIDGYQVDWWVVNME